MNPTKNCYHIIKFSSGLPYPTCSGYECIPHTWVTFHDPAKAAAVIAFPRRPVDASDDIRCLRKYDPSWSKFVVQLIFSTENFEEAYTSLKLFQSDTDSNSVPEEQSTDCTPPKSTPEPSHTTPATRTKRTAQPPQTFDPSSTRTKRTPLATHSRNHDQIPSAKTKTPDKIKPSKRIYKKKVIVQPNKKVIKKIYKKRSNKETNFKIRNSTRSDPEVLKKLDEIETTFDAAQEILLKLIEDSEKHLKLTSEGVMNLNQNIDCDQLSPYVSVSRVDHPKTKKLKKNF